MKRRLSRFTLYSIVVCLTYNALNSNVVAHQPDAGNGIVFGEAFDWQQDNRRFARSSAYLDVGEPFKVRLIYFLPSDRLPRSDIDAKFDTLIRDVQQFYADVMEHHGFGRKTFRFETNTAGKAVVHHVNGKLDEEGYRDWLLNVWDEIDEQYDTSRNIDLIAFESSNDFGGRGRGRSSSGKVLVPAFAITGVNGFNVDTSLVVHELGHAFGLHHDARDNVKLAPVSQNSTDAMASSLCAAEWFNVHRYFNLSQNAVNEDTTVQMLQPTFVEPPLGIRLQFQVTDVDGLHQAQLAAVLLGELIIIDCKRLNGTNATVEFVTTQLLGVSKVVLRVMDQYGNYAWVGHQFPIDIIPLLPPSEAISIPDLNLASAIRDRFGLASGDPITKLHMEGLRGLNARNRQISDLTGLQHAINIKFLWLDGNQISDITPLAGLTELLSLLLTENQISNISALERLTNLGQLWLRQNQISDISSLTGLTRLFSLGLSDNHITNLGPLAELTSLEELWISGNQISDITPLAGLTEKLEWLLLGHNQIGNISALAELTKLRILGLGYNRINDISPLVKIAGLESGDFVGVFRNPLNYPSIHVHAPTLRERGVEVLLSDRTPRRIRLVSGNKQQGSPGKTLGKPFVVEVRDQHSELFAGVPVMFDVTIGNGMLNTTSTTTDANGRAESRLTLGPNPGTNSVSVSVAEIPKQEVFTAEGIQVSKTLNVISGNNLQGQPGMALENPFVVEVRDQTDIPVPGVEVTFSVSRGGGTLSATSATTDGNGWAESTLTLGPDPGTNTVEVAVTGIQEKQTFTAEGVRVPKTLEIVSGDDQEGLPGAALDKPFVVEVRDQTDTPVPGVKVTFSVSSGGGTLSAASATTDSNGRAKSILTLGPNPGTNIVTVSVTGIQEVQTFTAEGVQIPRTLDIISGDNQEGLPGFRLEKPFVVEVNDQTGEPLPNVEVTFSVTSGGGRFSVTSVTTDSNGRATSTLTLGPSPGTNTVTVSVTGIQEKQSFTAEGIQVAKTLNVISGNNLQGQPGMALEKPFVVEVNDQTDKPLPGVQVTFTVSGGGGRLNATTATTDSDGRAESTLTLGPKLGTNTVTVSVTGIQEVQTFSAEGIRIPKTLEIVSGKGQQGPPGSALDKPFVVEVNDQTDKPLPGVQVAFTVSGGGGRLNATTATTDSDGRAESTLTLGPKLGANTVTVSVAGIQEEMTFTAEGIRTPKAFWIISGFDQKGLVGEALPRPIVVEVRDQSGEPLPGAEVTFSVSSGGGRLSVTSVTTNSHGRAESTLTLGPVPGTNTVEVAVAGIQQRQAATAIGELPPIPEDVNMDDVVNILDLVSVASALGDEGTDLAVDVNGDGIVNILDLVLVAGALGNAAAAPSAWYCDLEIAPTRADVGEWLAQAQRLDLTDATSQRGVLFLEQLLATLIPEETVLLPNYPNPFNPETWIPYRLAEDAFVTLTIYDARGRVVRALEIGHQAAAFYESRTAAIYWDGRNELRERVASGVYFYHLSAGEYSAARKMLIVK